MARTNQVVTTYDRPTPAVLVVRLKNGEEWEAAPGDLEKFGFGERTEIYHRARTMLREALGLERFTDDSLANDIRYLMECAIVYKHSPWADENGVPWPVEEDAEAGNDFCARLREGLLRPEVGA